MYFKIVPMIHCAYPPQWINSQKLVDSATGFFYFKLLRNIVDYRLVILKNIFMFVYLKIKRTGGSVSLLLTYMLTLPNGVIMLLPSLLFF